MMYGFTGLYGSSYGLNIVGTASPGGSGAGSTSDPNDRVRILTDSLNRANERAKDYYSQLQSVKAELATAKAEIEAARAEIESLNAGTQIAPSSSSAVPTWAYVVGAMAVTAGGAYLLRKK